VSAIVRVTIYVYACNYVHVSMFEVETPQIWREAGRDLVVTSTDGVCAGQTMLIDTPLAAVLHR
jgi:hypothetical protein